MKALSHRDGPIQIWFNRGLGLEGNRPVNRAGP